jgi:GTP-binding protein EngB required for normal cell division
MAYGNLAYDKTEKKFRKEKREYFLLYNNNREEGVAIMNSSLKKKDSDKEVKVLYNSGYVQISSIVSLQNQIRAINNKMDKMAEEKEKEKVINETQKTKSCLNSLFSMSTLYS